MLSIVVKRAPQAEQKRRRRMAELSSVGRESFTCVSGFEQYGHRILPFPLPLLQRATSWVYPLASYFAFQFIDKSENVDTNPGLGPEPKPRPPGCRFAARNGRREPRRSAARSA